jgi:hypothetical protein
LLPLLQRNDGGEPHMRSANALIMKETFLVEAYAVGSACSRFRQAMTDRPMEPVCP